MNDYGEAAGTAIEGSLLARAVEPSHEVVSASNRTDEACRNCGTKLVCSDCHHCGQRADVHRTLSAFFHDLLHGVLHFEGKIWRTLPLLVWHPGKLTREYIDGKRAKYVSPIALFLFVVFLSFAVFQLLGGSKALLENIEIDGSAVRSAEAEYAQTSEQLASDRNALAAAQDEGDAEAIERLAESIAELETEEAALAGALKLMGSDLVPEGAETRDVPLEVETRSSWQQVKNNPQLLAYKLQTNVYKFAWLLIPISVPFVWLLYCWKRRFRFYDHTVFTTYSITFMIALAGLSGLLIYYGSIRKWDGLQLLGALLMLYAPVHMYRQLRGTYGSTRIGAFLRMLALSTFAWIAIGLFAMVLAAMA